MKKVKENFGFVTLFQILHILCLRMTAFSMKYLKKKASKLIRLSVSWFLQFRKILGNLNNLKNFVQKHFFKTLCQSGDNTRKLILSIQAHSFQISYLHFNTFKYIFFPIEYLRSIFDKVSFYCILVAVFFFFLRTLSFSESAHKLVSTTTEALPQQFVEELKKYFSDIHPTFGSRHGA